MRACLRAGADPDARGRDGWTPLHWAAVADNAAAIEALLEGGADPGARDVDGNTPLHWGALMGQAAAIEALLDGGADAGAKDRARQIPFDLIPGNSPLVGTSAYWRLSDARWD